MSEKKLDSDIEMEVQQLEDSLGPNFKGEILGYGVMYTVGADWNCLVPRDWLLARIDDLDIPQWMAPNKPAPHYAYKRTIKRLRESWIEPYSVTAPRMDNGIPENHKVTVDLKDGDGQYVWHVRAEVFFDEDECKESGGKWVPHDLGYFNYNSDAKAFRSHINEDIDSEDNHLRKIWEDVSNAAEIMFREMQTTHIAQDIRKMMYYATRDYTDNVIQLRRSVYLFPAGMGDFVDKMSTLYGEINENFKTTGEPVAVRSFELLNTDDKQEWVTHKVEETMEEKLDQVLDVAFERFDEGEAASKTAQTIRENLDSPNDTAETYNGLLETELSVERILEEQKNQIMDEEKKDIIDSVLDQTDISDF